jgi:hypothetical protein
MKNHIQTIINVCFAISVTLLIYQNTQLKERLSTLDLATLEMSIENDITLAKLKNDVESNFELIGLNKEIQDEINLLHVQIMADNEVNIGIAFDNFDIAKKNLDITDAKIQENSSTLDHIQKYLSENFGK